ncbi:nuclear distribution protein nudE-like 1-A [Anopheles bellator]|uniref:nuclear distribution protein nudE-like 1-A n=1 Tax=Anopheles bellator TaxID=139047 RepID=UPI002648DE5D|nr:nuclear distribution protein nudE-like 1-A [Anopheles bellator]
MMEGKLFTSVEEECRHWKERCLKVSQERDDAQREFDDFTAESRQLEAELEMTVEQQEKKIRDLNQVVSQLHGECEAYKRKLQYTENETSKLDTDYRLLAKENEKLKVYIRELEQKNDDLERANRVASESVVEFESMLNQAYEKNALLELEVDEKERMQIKLQRLMDEARDLKQELKVRTLKTDENGDEDEAGAEQRHSKADTANDDGTGATTLVGSDTVTSAQLTQVCLGANGPLGPDTKLETLNNNLNASKQRLVGPLSPLAKFGATGKLADSPSFREVDGEESKTLLESSAKGSAFLPATSPTSQLIIERNGNATSTALVPLVPGGGGSLNPPMASSDRVSTLNIVADLLRRLDNMEAKLKAWKIRKPSSRTGGGSGVGPGSVSSAGSHRSLHGNTQHNHHHHSSHLQQHQQPSSYHSHHQHSAGVGGSNHSLNSLGADATTGASTPLLGNCCGSSSSGGGGGGIGSSGGNVQLHSYQPSTITIGTQTSQHQSALPKAEVLLGRTAK